jgi:hypothetical protein
MASYMRPRITLSKKRHLPVWNVMGSTYPLWDFKILRVLRQFEPIGPLPNVDLDHGKVPAWDDGGVRETITVLHKPSGTVMTEFAYYFWTMLMEWFVRGDWERQYLPNYSLEGKTILEVGAGCGETAFFYIQHGASKVISVEIFEPAVKLLKQNVAANKWPVEVIDKPFDLSMLDIPHDYLKVDIEGGEFILSNSRNLGPCSIEAHSEEIIKSLIQAYPDFQFLPYGRNSGILKRQ